MRMKHPSKWLIVSRFKNGDKEQDHFMSESLLFLFHFGSFLVFATLAFMVLFGAIHKTALLLIIIFLVIGWLYLKKRYFSIKKK